MVWASITEGPKLVVKLCTTSNFIHFWQEHLQTPVPSEVSSPCIIFLVLFVLVQVLWKSPSSRCFSFCDRIDLFYLRKPPEPPHILVVWGHWQLCTNPFLGTDV